MKIISKCFYYKKLELLENLELHTLNFYAENLLCLQSSASGSFLQICINFVEQFKFSHFEGSIIP